MADAIGKPCPDPVKWTPELVEHHIRKHIVDNELKIRLRLQDYELMRENVADQCFTVVNGRPRFDDKAMKTCSMISKQMRDLERGLK